MTLQTTLLADDLEKIRRLDTCTVSNAIERFKVRLRNEGFIHGSVECQFPNFPPMLGYAATARIRSSWAPMTGRCYYDRMDWWSYVVTIPEPRVLVLQDVDHLPGIGAFVGEIHAQIALALNCVGCVTNGAVRDLPAVEKLAFTSLPGVWRLALVRAHRRLWGAGRNWRTQDQTGRPDPWRSPRRTNDSAGIADEIPSVAARLVEEERELIELCQSPDFSLEKLASGLRLTNRHGPSERFAECGQLPPMILPDQPLKGRTAAIASLFSLGCIIALVASGLPVRQERESQCRQRSVNRECWCHSRSPQNPRTPADGLLRTGSVSGDRRLRQRIGLREASFTWITEAACKQGR